MLRLILFLVFLIASVCFGIMMAHYPGYLVVIVKPWTVEMPLWFAALTVLFFLALFYLLITSIDQMQFLLYRIKSWFKTRRQRRLYSKTQQGLTTLIEGNWLKAENLLLAGVDQTEEPLMNYLGAAKAAHKRDALEKRDRYLQKAYDVAPDASLAIGLTQAKFEMEQYSYAKATATLEHLRHQHPNHPEVLKGLEKVYMQCEDWAHLRELLPHLKKSWRSSKTKSGLIEKQIYCHLFNMATTKSADQIESLWQQTPRYLRKDPDLISAYLHQLARFPAYQKNVEEMIRKVLKHEWHAELITLYSTLPFTNFNRQLSLGATWLQRYGQQPPLLLLLGKLCAQIQLWGKAKDYFEKCLAQGPNLEASLHYGQLLEQLDHPEDALQIYKNGVLLALDKKH